jgi:transposase-like protein
MNGLRQRADREPRLDWWRRQIQRQEGGSVTVAEFCRQLGVGMSTFYYWKQQLRAARKAAFAPILNSVSARRAASPSAASASFVPVSIRDSAPSTHLEIELANTCVVRLEGPIDPKLLKAAIRAAGQLSGPQEGAR